MDLTAYASLIAESPLRLVAMVQNALWWVFAAISVGFGLGLVFRADPDWMGRILGTTAVAGFFVYGMPPLIQRGEVPFMPSVVLGTVFLGTWLAFEALSVVLMPIARRIRSGERQQ